MSLAIVRSRALVGLSAPEVRVEVHVGRGLPAFHIVGLPEAAVRESRERVRAALVHRGFDFPNRRLTVNLAPADLPKDSGRFDLPIAIGVLAASGQLPVEPLEALELAGELSLTGELRPIRGSLPMAIAARAAGRRLVVPATSADEAAVYPEVAALAANHLGEVCLHLLGASPLARVDHQLPPPAQWQGANFSDIRGHAQARRALEIAAAGGHSALMVGPPGAGKSMLASRLASILPPLSSEEALEVASVQALAGNFNAAHWGRRPMRAPHHSASAAALVGGGPGPRPGEISLAHHGVLFLDELPEFSRPVLEALREPLETGHITLARASRSIDLPARFQLIAAMNPCSCGHLGDPRCRCSTEQVLRYQRRVSGPLLDRLDLLLSVARLSETDLLERTPVETSDTIRLRVEAAWARQLSRQGCANARLDAQGVARHCALGAEAETLIVAASQRLRWSARGVHRALRVARTIADLAGSEVLERNHLAEAIGYRRSPLELSGEAG
ncbi:MAG: ATP-binding protein [Betaproteobacteria bacterium]|nr:ATP-binding protein [Betaproteobacteria bacterium]